MPSSRGSSQSRDWNQVSHIAGRFFTIWATREVFYLRIYELICPSSILLHILYFPSGIIFLLSEIYPLEVLQVNLSVLLVYLKMSFLSSSFWKVFLEVPILGWKLLSVSTLKILFHCPWLPLKKKKPVDIIGILLIDILLWIICVFSLILFYVKISTLVFWILTTL